MLWTLAGLACLGLALGQRGWMLVALWPGVTFLVLGIAYGLGAHGFYGKRADGTLPLWSRVLLFPLVGYAWAVWHLLRLLEREPAYCVVDDHLVIGRRLLSSEFRGHFENVVDLTAEFTETRALRRAQGYVAFPILDGAAPAPEELRRVVEGLRPGRTLVHCAQGHGRTALFSVAWVLACGRASTIDEAFGKLKAVRPGMRLNRTQRRCLERFAAKG